MARGNAEPLESKIHRLAAVLNERDDALDREGVRRALETAGIDPARVTARFHEAAQRLAGDVRRSGKPGPLSLGRAIAQTDTSAVSAKRKAPGSDPAHSVAEPW